MTALVKHQDPADLLPVERAAQLQPTAGVMEVPIAEIVRKPSRPVDQDHVAALAESMAAIGLLAPIPLDPQRTALAGEHRIQAALKLGWTTIPAVTRTLEGLLAELAALDENLIRHNGDALWRGEAYQRRQELYEALHPETKHGGARAGAGRKSSRHGGDLKTEAQQAEKMEESATPPRFTADTAAKTNVSERTVQRHVGAAKKLNPEAKEAIRGTSVAESITELEHLAKLPAPKQVAVARRAVEKGETVKRAVKQLRREERIAEVKAYVPPAGEYGVISTDVPWKYDDELDGSDAARGGLPYPPMEIEEICALKVPAAKDCILWFWVTNTHVINGNAAKVLAAWGFTPKTMYTWDKVLMANGRWGRGQTEHVILAVRGHPVGVFEAERNLFSEQRAQVHSRKPEAFYRLVERSCPCAPGARLEMFATQEREGWVTSGAELVRGEATRVVLLPRGGFAPPHVETAPAGPAAHAAPLGSLLSVERFTAEATDLGFTTRPGKHRTVHFLAARCGTKACKAEFRVALNHEGLAARTELQQLREHARSHVGKPAPSRTKRPFGHEPMTPGWKNALKDAKRASKKKAKKGGRRR